MRIVHLYDGHERVYGGRGSVPEVVWQLARGTAGAGHEVAVIERRWNGLDPTADHNGVHFERLDLRTGADEPWTRVPYELVQSPTGLGRLVVDRVNFARAAYPRLRRLDPDIVHAHLPFAASVLATFRPAWRDRLVFTGHLGDIRLNLVEGELAEEVPGVLASFSPDIYLANRAARTTVLNSGIEAAFRDRGVPGDRLTVIPDGVDYDRYADISEDRARATREEYAPPGDGPVILFVGTVMPRKGLDILVDALGSLADRGTKVRAIIAGEDELDDAYARELRAQVERVGIADRVAFPGFVPSSDLPALYAGADVFVLPSLAEGFGMTVLEAMAAGTPVVATRVGGVPDVVTDGEHGILVDVGDVEGLAAALERLIDAPDNREEMGDNARDRAEAFSWNAVVADFETVYREVAA